MSVNDLTTFEAVDARMCELEKKFGHYGTWLRGDQGQPYTGPVWDEADDNEFNRLKQKLRELHPRRTEHEEAMKAYDERNR